MTTLTSFTARLRAGEMLHLWARPVLAGVPSQVTLRDAAGGTHLLAGPPSDDFQMIAHPVTVTGETVLTWNPADSQVSVCYAYDPAEVAAAGIASSGPSRGPRRRPPASGCISRHPSAG